MATMVRLAAEVDPIVRQVYERKNEAEVHRYEEYVAVVKIQSWYRAVRARAYLKYLVDCAGIIQKRFRGFQGRHKYRVCLQNEVFVMKLNRYNSMATKIQKCWRGFYTRKYVFNYYSFKRYLNSLQQKNQEIREMLAAYKEQQEQETMNAEIQAHRSAKENWLQKHHYLVSTVAVPGIYNSPYLPHPTEVEHDLRSTKPKLMSNTNRKQKPTKFNPSSARYDLPAPKPQALPPLPEKPQGPFRDPAEVRSQRYKPFNPSLRVETSYFSLEEAREATKREEWTNRLIDTPFKPFTHKEQHYDPLHHTSTQYGHLPYGTAYFREEFPMKFVSQQNMKTVVPPIPVFDKLNTTYSQGEV